MSHNKSRLMQMAVRHLDFIADHINRHDPHVLPGDALKHIKLARKILLRDIRKRRDARDREFKHPSWPTSPGIAYTPRSNDDFSD